MKFKDLAGQEVKSGDFIVYATGRTSNVELNYAVVVEVTTKKGIGNYYNALRIVSAGRWWYPATKAEREKTTVVMMSQRILKLYPEQVTPKILKQLQKVDIESLKKGK